MPRPAGRGKAMTDIRLRAIPAFDDNYIWLMSLGRQAVVVDPGDAAPVLAALEGGGLKLRAVLLTHHHADHVGGVAALLADQPVPVYGPALEGIPTVTRPLADGDRLAPFDGHAGFEVLALPGHTRGHIAYYDGARLFCGDTLFPCGCGRVFEGTMAQMHASLARLAALPPATQVYCAHEYSLANARFALAVEPDNRALQARQRWMAARREAGLPTVPSLLRDELDTNPFLRCGAAPVRERVAAHGGRMPADEAETFALLREWKNVF